MNEEAVVQQVEQRLNLRRLRPCTLHNECQHLFLTVLSQHPFIETFYHGSTLPNQVRCPAGQKGIRLTNALARLNTEHLFAQYALPEHGNMTAECCAIIEVIFESAHAIRRVDEGGAESQAMANDAMFDFHFDLFTFIFIMTEQYNQSYDIRSKYRDIRNSYSMHFQSKLGQKCHNEWI